ncbi:hypothetical protein AW812_RS19215 [Acinetobacter baumannii]|nr:hypothetical protein [Acinetobacter baumannii]EIB7123333.1 hypothetical protein [Acinetobacter baumannii]
MSTNSRKVVHDIACAFYRISFKNEKLPKQPRGKFSHFFSVEQVFDFIAKHNHKDLTVSSVKGRYVYSITEIKKNENALFLLIERSDKESEDVRIFNRPQATTKLVPFEEGDELQKFFHVVIHLDPKNKNSGLVLVEQYAGGTGYTFGYIITNILHNLRLSNIQPDFFKVPYEGGGTNEDGSPRIVEFATKTEIDNVCGLSLIDRAAQGNLLSISAIEEKQKKQIEDDPLLVIAKKEVKYVPDPTIFLDQNGQELDKSFLSDTFNALLDKIKRDASLGQDFFYRIRCKEKSRIMSIDIKGDFVESDFGVKIEFIEGFERQAVTQTVASDQKLFNRMNIILARHKGLEILPDDGINS